MQRGAKEAKDVAGLVAASDIVILCVTGSQQVEDLVYRKGGILGVRAQRSILVDTSTSQPRLYASNRGRPQGQKACASSMHRSRVHPWKRNRDESNTHGRCRSRRRSRKSSRVLKAFCENIFHVGGVGAGHKIKLINTLCRDRGRCH